LSFELAGRKRGHAEGYILDVLEPLVRRDLDGL